MAKTNIYVPFIAINLYHSTFLRNADPDLDENSGGSTDLNQKIARIGGYPYPLFTPLLAVSHATVCLRFVPLCGCFAIIVIIAWRDMKIDDRKSIDINR